MRNALRSLTGIIGLTTGITDQDRVPLDFRNCGYEQFEEGIAHVTCFQRISYVYGEIGGRRYRFLVDYEGPDTALVSLTKVMNKLRREQKNPTAEKLSALNPPMSGEILSRGTSMGCSRNLVGDAISAEGEPRISMSTVLYMCTYNPRINEPVYVNRVKIPGTK